MKCTGIVATLFAATGIVTAVPVTDSAADITLPVNAYLIIAGYDDTPGLERRDVPKNAIEVRIAPDTVDLLTTRTPDTGVDSIILAPIYAGAVAADEAAGKKA
ncbi:hypothetical protein SEUCBS139899_005530 [Sporothrix eucalyptigena]